MMEALWLWRQFPRQIASDLSQFHSGRRISDWHRGTCDDRGFLVLSSYELLELIEFLPESGAFKSAARGGAWTEDQIVAAETFNEIARFRASYHAVNGGKDGAYEPFSFDDPAIRVRKAREAEAELAWKRESQGSLFDELGWSSDA
ncbi:hypothetical protein A5742_27470 [Mycolicibacterium fortuitum]|uniref:Tail assembly chaperone n=1 Tax=Mycolicibacterium fortuitum TaxID=1766 RepID=A0ABD6QN99_MYCFO|nr:hypothetical protein A5742_27470 [Mycolicibacterium fortuitum]